MTILISHPDMAWSNLVKANLSKASLESEICTDGKDCQLKIYKGRCKTVILDLETTNHSGLEVLKYLKVNFPEIKVIFTISSKKILEDIQLGTDTLNKLGVTKIFIMPFSMESLVKSVENREDQLAEWKNLTGSDVVAQTDEKTINARDEDFTRVKLTEMYSGNLALFDHFIRLSPGKFIKILNRGERLEESRLKKFSEEKQLEFLYFKTRDRASYVNFVNEMLSKAINSQKISSAEKVTMARSASEKFIEEIYTAGIKPELINEGKKLCQNIYEFLQREKDLINVLDELKDYEPTSQNHLFLTSFFSTMICKNLDWATARTVENVAMGALLHDVGMLKLPPVVRETPYSKLNADQKTLYQKHPLLGVELLNKFAYITDPVKQIVYQHHETSDGMGYPNALNSLRIYPMAKIVALADEFAGILIDNKIPPLEGLKHFLNDKTNLKKFDPLIIKSLFQGFVKVKKD